MIERHIPEITDLRIATKINEAKNLVQQFQPQLVFQDIVMPEKNGFEFLNEVKNINFEIIFTTAFNEFAIRAIRFSALDYLLKPVNADELRSAIDRFAEKQGQKKETDALLNNLLQNLGKKEEDDFKLAVPTTAGAVFFSPAEIVRLEGEGNYTRFFLSDGRRHMSSKTMKEYEEICPGCGDGLHCIGDRVSAPHRRERCGLSTLFRGLGVRMARACNTQSWCPAAGGP